MDRFKAACFALVVMAAFAAFLIYPSLPERVPTHWNAAGQVDAYGPAWFGAFVFPLVMAFILLLFVAIPKIAVFKENLKAFEKHYWLLGFVIQTFFLLFYILTILPNYGFRTNISQPIVLLMGVFFITIGFLMPSFKRNFFVGIRTPWTLADDMIWEETHILGAKLFIASGIVALISAFAPGGIAILFSMAAILAAAAIVILYSFLLFSKSGKRQL